MNRFEPSAFGRTEFGGGGDFGLFGSAYPTNALAPSVAPFSAAPPSLMSLGAMAPPPNAPMPLSAQANYPPPSVVPPPSAHLQSAVPPSMGVGGVGAGSAGMSNTGVNTNSRHPLAVKARVFVGNLNTNVVTRDEFEQMFRRFGEVLAVSMHRGYGFIQYAFEYEARGAISFTDGMILGGQRLDVNLASEPKSGREMKSNKRQADTSVSESPTKRSRPNADGKGVSASTVPKPLFPSKTSAANVEVTTSATKTVPTKAAAVTSKSTASNISVVTNKKTEPAVKVSNTATSSALKTITTVKSDVNGSDANSVPCIAAPGTTESSPDVLICGCCRSLFDNLATFTAHRKEKCAKYPAATTATTTAQKPVVTKAEGEPDALLCFICQKTFGQSWQLIVHVSKEHNITIYYTGKAVADGAEKADTTKEKPPVATTTKAAVAKKEKEDGKTN